MNERKKERKKDKQKEEEEEDRKKSHETVTNLRLLFRSFSHRIARQDKQKEEHVNTRHFHTKLRSPARALNTFQRKCVTLECYLRHAASQLSHALRLLTQLTNQLPSQPELASQQSARQFVLRVGLHGLADTERDPTC